jgi:hypothetical protein
MRRRIHVSYEEEDTCLTCVYRPLLVVLRGGMTGSSVCSGFRVYARWFRFTH